MLRSLHVTIVTVKPLEDRRRRVQMSTEHVPLEVATVGPARPGARSRMLGATAAIVLLQLPWPRWIFAGRSLSDLVLRELVFWLMTALLLAYVLFGERRPLRSIGLVKPDWRSVAWGIGGGAALTIAGLALI